MSKSGHKKPTRVAYLSGSGSSGKTSQAVAKACHLAERGYSVRVWDVDGQGDATKYFNLESAEFVLSDVLRRGGTMVDDPNTGKTRKLSLADIELPILQDSKEDVKRWGGYCPLRANVRDWMSRITVMPSGLGVSGVQLDATFVEMQQDPLSSQKVKAAIERMDEEGTPPDFEIYDLHGTIGFMTYLVLSLVRVVVTTVVPDEKTTGGHLVKLIDIINEVAGVNQGLSLNAIIPVKCRPPRDGEFYVDIVNELKSNYPDIVTPEVREAVVVPESYGAREPMLYYVPAHKVTKQQRRVVDWFFDRKIF